MKKRLRLHNGAEDERVDQNAIREAVRQRAIDKEILSVVESIQTLFHVDIRESPRVYWRIRISIISVMETVASGKNWDLMPLTDGPAIMFNRWFGAPDAYDTLINFTDADFREARDPLPTGAYLHRQLTEVEQRYANQDSDPGEMR